MMKNAHFYLQSAMLILALSIAVQLPNNLSLIIYVTIIEFTLLVYQVLMSLMLMNRLTYHTQLLKTHVYSCLTFISTIILLLLVGPDWMTPGRWKFVIYVFPWALIVLFLVTLDELERARNYRI